MGCSVPGAKTVRKGVRRRTPKGGPSGGDAGGVVRPPGLLSLRVTGRRCCSAG
jgi:hypothetical protein